MPSKATRAFALRAPALILTACAGSGRRNFERQLSWQGTTLVPTVQGYVADSADAAQRPRSTWQGRRGNGGAAAAGSASASVIATSQLGDLITMAGTLSWVFYTRGAASLPDHSPLELTALTAAAALPWFAASGVQATACGLVPLPSPAVLAELAPQLLYIAVVPTVAAALAFNLDVRRLGAPVGTLFLNIVPVSVIAVRAVLGAPPQASELMRAGLVVMALALHAWPAHSAPVPGLVRAGCPGV